MRITSSSARDDFKRTARVKNPAMPEDSTKLPLLMQRSAMDSSCEVNCVRARDRPDPESQSPIFPQRGVLPGLPTSRTAMSADASFAATPKKRGQKSLGAPANCRRAASSSIAPEKSFSISLLHRHRCSDSRANFSIRIVKNSLNSREPARRIHDWRNETNFG